MKKIFVTFCLAALAALAKQDAGKKTIPAAMK